MASAPDIEIIDELRLSQKDLTGINALLNVCFEDQFADRSFFVQRHHVRFIQRSGAKIVGHLALTYRAVGINGKMTSIFGIADVAVTPEQRKKGVGAALVAAALALAQDGQAEYMLLFGAAKLYRRAGFIRVRNPMVWLEHEGFASKTIARRPSEHLMVYALGQKEWDPDAEVDLLSCLF